MESHEEDSEDEADSVASFLSRSEHHQITYLTLIIYCDNINQRFLNCDPQAPTIFKKACL